MENIISISIFIGLLLWIIFRFVKVCNHKTLRLSVMDIFLFLGIFCLWLVAKYVQPIQWLHNDYILFPIVLYIIHCNISLCILRDGKDRNEEDAETKSLSDDNIRLNAFFLMLCNPLIAAGLRFNINVVIGFIIFGFILMMILDQFLPLSPKEKAYAEKLKKKTFRKSGFETVSSEEKILFKKFVGKDRKYLRVLEITDCTICHEDLDKAFFENPK